jgi:hypothetical protein
MYFIPLEHVLLRVCIDCVPLISQVLSFVLATSSYLLVCWYIVCTRRTCTETPTFFLD